MNSGTGNLIGSVSYELASDEACRTKAQHEARPSPSKHARHKPSARQGHGCVGRAAWAAARTRMGSPCGCRVCVSLCSCTIPKTIRIST